jgi:phosphatidylethanolamine-binding protein (PEBP) family uncharacterized protein
MRRPLEAFSSVALLLALALSGCGSSGSGSASAGAFHPVPANGGATTISLTSTAITAGALPAQYTCDGANIAPPLKWGTVSNVSREVVLFALGLTHGATSPTSSSIEWVMAGLKPQLHGIGAGEVPSGAFLVSASDGKKHYSICPPKGETKRYEFAIYAMPPLVTVGTHINGVKLLHNLAAGPPQDRGPGKGEFVVTYRRK